MTKGTLAMPDREPKRHLVKDERGLTTVEYIIVLGLVAVLGISTWQKFGDTLIDEVDDAKGQMSKGVK